MGISIVMSVCLTGKERLEVIPVNRYFPQRVYGIVSLNTRTRSPQALEFIAMFKKSLAKSSAVTLRKLQQPLHDQEKLG